MVLIRPWEHSHFSFEPEYGRRFWKRDFSSIARKTHIQRVNLLAKTSLPDFLH